jgi:ectoine hydroxylase-related dioxygenase (phytanoyl-CoA dioxygenase family)
LRQAMDEYSCPPGSVVIFTESLVHAANDWTNPNNARCAVFNCYNSAWAQWHKLNLDHETIMAMPPLRRSLFRAVSELGNNGVYSLDNRAL